MGGIPAGFVSLFISPLKLITEAATSGALLKKVFLEI